MPEKNRTALDAATEITVAAVTAGRIVSKTGLQEEFQNNVIEFFSAVYKRILQDTPYRS